MLLERVSGITKCDILLLQSENSANVANTISINVRTTVSINSDHKKVR